MMRRWFGWVKALAPRKVLSPLTLAYVFLAYTVVIAWYAIANQSPVAAACSSVCLGLAAILAIREINNRKEAAHADSLSLEVTGPYTPQHSTRRVTLPSNVAFGSQFRVVPGFAPYGGHRGGTQAHRVGAGGSAVGGAYGGAGGTGAGVNEFSGVAAKTLEEGGFAAGSLKGVRSFEVDQLGRLTGVTYRSVWKPGENKAECLRDQAYSYINLGSGTLSIPRGIVGYFDPEHLVESDEPHSMSDCKHGFYAYYDGSDDYHDKGRVSAVVEGYGECVVGTRGFRAMKARILALHIPDTVLPHVRRLIERNYAGIPVLESFERMVAEFPPDAAGNDLNPDIDPDFWTRNAS